jgi:hypothetical protein
LQSKVSYSVPLEAAVSVVSRPIWTRPNWYAEDIKIPAHQPIAEDIIHFRRLLGPA